TVFERVADLDIAVACRRLRLSDAESHELAVGCGIAGDADAPDVLKAASKAVSKASRDLDFTRLDDDHFAKSPDISIDYAIMEKTSKAAVV
ncbi:hypothetical protein ACC706_36560, partial [Rhizobium johnstonii]